MKKVLISATTLIAACISTYSQNSGTYFVDGFHGGVYGHYPMESYTKYMSDLLDQHPDWKMCIEIEPETWDSVKVVTPEEFVRFREKVAGSGRIEFTNPSYAQPYCYNVSGESLIRQFEYGIKSLKRNFPGISFSTYAVEEPCFTSCLPQILKGFGFSYASIKCPNTCWGGYAAARGGELVQWTGPDGSALLASPRHEIEALGDNVWTTIANGESNDDYFKACFDAGFKHPVGMCYQDAGWTWGPWLGSDGRRQGETRYVTWKEYFEDIAIDVEPEVYHFHQEDACGGLVWGSEVMNNIAREVREAENGLVGAEKIGVIANLANGYRYSGRDMDEAWRCLLLSQHHDSWIVPYNNLKNKGTWADWICGTWTGTSDLVRDRVIAGAKASFMTRSKEDRQAYIRVFNTLPQKREEVVSLEVQEIPSGATVSLTDADGKKVECWFGPVDGTKRLVFMAKVPAFGYASYKLDFEGEGDAQSLCTPANVLENEMYRIEFNPDRGGTVRSLIAKKDGRREVAAKGDIAFGEIRGYFYDEKAFRSSADGKASTYLVEDNPFEKKMRVCGMIAGHPFVETVTIRKNDPKIDFDLTIDWQGNPGIGTFRQNDGWANPVRSCYDENGKLNVYFTNGLKRAKLFKNAPFDVCESRLESTQFNNWNEIKHNIILNWIDLEGRNGKSIALLTDHTGAYVNSPDKPLGLTVQYSGNGLWGRDYHITGATRMHFAVLPHSGGWEQVESEDRCWNEPLVCSAEAGRKAEEKSFIESADYEISAAHLTEGGVLVRLYNASSDDAVKSVLLDGSFNSAIETDLEGNELSAISLGSRDGRKV
ncbi:MAG: alpha-mannosidase, partial [Bacteroidales bacterium]|nr:alpha-mannosidase [Bacteroidales bacterium]